METKKIKPEHEKVKSFVHGIIFDIEVDEEDDPKHHKKHETRNTKVKMLIPEGRPQRNKRMLMLFFSENQSEYGLGGPNITLCAQPS